VFGLHKSTPHHPKTGKVLGEEEDQTGRVRYSPDGAEASDLPIGISSNPIQIPVISLVMGRSSSEATQFVCPTCGAAYKVVRVEAASLEADRPITCRRCGGPLNGREGRFILKYFLTDRPKAQFGRPRHRLEQ